MMVLALSSLIVVAFIGLTTFVLLFELDRADQEGER